MIKLLFFKNKIKTDKIKITDNILDNTIIKYETVITIFALFIL